MHTDVHVPGTTNRQHTYATEEYYIAEDVTVGKNGRFMSGDEYTGHSANDIVMISKGAMLRKLRKTKNVKIEENASAMLGNSYNTSDTGFWGSFRRFVK